MSVIAAAVLDRGVTDATTSGSRPESPAAGELREPPRAPPGFHRLREGERRRYPDYLLPIAGRLVPDDERFAEAREQMLLSYRPQTARAYRADLDDIYAWSVKRGFDLLDLSDRQQRQYAALLRRRAYSENTVRRRLCTWKLFQAAALSSTEPPARMPSAAVLLRCSPT